MCKPSPALVVSFVAMFFSLAGTGLAASRPAVSVGAARGAIAADHDDWPGASRPVIAWCRRGTDSTVCEVATIGCTDAAGLGAEAEIVGSNLVRVTGQDQRLTVRLVGEEQFAVWADPPAALCQRFGDR